MLASDLRIERVDFTWGNITCAIEEGCIAKSGQRLLLRYSTRIVNQGTGDCVVGVTPAIPENRFALHTADHEFWEWSPCHQHWHVAGYARAELREFRTGRVLSRSSKNGFCLMDTACFGPSSVPKFSCQSMGLTAGCYDDYLFDIPCQWVDLTESDLEMDDYGYPDESQVVQLCVKVNFRPDLYIEETNYDNNEACVMVDFAKLMYAAG